MNRVEWINRCAERLVKLGVEPMMAGMDAVTLADDETEKNGASGAAWRSPEDVADEYQASIDEIEFGED